MPKRRSHNPDSSIQQVHKANIHQPNRSSKFACLGPTFKCQIWIVQRLKFLISKMHNCKISILTSLVHVHVAELNAKKIMSFQRPNVKAHNLEYTFQCLRIVSLVLHIMSKLISNVAKGLRLKPLYPMSQVLCPLSNFGSANMFFKNTSSAFRTTTSAHDAKSEIQRRRLTFNVELIQNLTAETHSPFKTFPCKSQSIDLSSNIPNSKWKAWSPSSDLCRQNSTAGTPAELNFHPTSIVLFTQLGFLESGLVTYGLGFGPCHRGAVPQPKHSRSNTFNYYYWALQKGRVPGAQQPVQTVNF